MTKEELRISRQLWEERSSKNDKYYVYLYIDPRDKSIFYVGKGQRNRVFSHLADKADKRETNKKNKINEIRSAGIEPDIDILVDNIDEKTAMIIESAVIDLIGIDNLTNIKLGYNSQRCPIIRSSRIRKEAKIKHNVLLIIINQAYPQYFRQRAYNPSDKEDNDLLFAISRMMWRLSTKKIKDVQYFLPVYKGTILDVFEIDHTINNGILKIGEAYERDMFSLVEDGNYIFNGYKKRLIEKSKIDDITNRTYKYLIFGKLAPDNIRSHYINNYINTKSIFNPIKYIFISKQR